MNKGQFLANVDNIISMEVFDATTTWKFAYRHPTTETKTKWFGPNKKINVPGGYRKGDGWGEILPTLKEVFEAETHNQSEYIAIKTGKGSDGPCGAAFIKPRVKIKMVGGKYVGEKILHFNTYEEATGYVTEISEKHPNKFTTIYNK